MNVIYVDDERIQLDNFRMTVQNLDRISSLYTFANSKKALEWVTSNPVDVAFLDIEMPGMNGIELAKKMKERNRNIRIIFVTAYDQYALQAFGVDAIGYLLKPYDSEDIEKQLEKAYYIRDIPSKKIQITTMPNLSISVDEKKLVLGNTKQAELLALFIDRGKTGVTKLDAIEVLWMGYSSESVYWTTMSRLKAILEEAGIPDLILSQGQMKYINTDAVECDLYRMLNGDKDAIQNYRGKYLEEYPWAKVRRKQLDELKKNSIL